MVKLPRQRPVFRHEPGYYMHFPSPSVLMIALAPFVLWTVLFVLAEYGNLMLKPLKPWLGAALLLLFGINILGVALDRRWRFASIAAYFGATLVYGRLKGRYLFESHLKATRSSRLTVTKPTYVAVRYVAIASPWYSEQFGLRKLAASEQAWPDGIALQFNESTGPVVLIPKDNPTVFRPSPIFFTRKVGTVRDQLIAKGVSAGPVQQDRQGTVFFEILDAEGNTIEISAQP